MNILSQTPQAKAASPQKSSGMKILFRIAIVLMLLCVIAIVAIGFFFDSFAKTMVEIGGTTAMGVETEVESVSVGFRSGTFDMRQMHIANPAGFSEQDFFSLGTARLQVDTGSFSGDTIVIPEILIEGVTIAIEQDSKGSNYGKILNNLKRFETTGGEPAPDGEPSEPAPSGQDKKFIVKNITLRDVKANVKLDLLGKKSDFTIPVPDFTIDNVGNSGEAQSVGDLLSTILQEVLNNVAENGGGLLPADMVSDIKGQLDGLSDVAGTLVDDLGSDLKNVLDGTGNTDDLKNTAKDSAKQVKDGLKGLLRKD